MRVFHNLSEAAKEIRRDLSKAAVYPTERVQHLEQSGIVAREWMNYSYTILPEGIPTQAVGLMPVVRDNFNREYPTDNHISDLVRWAEEERLVRLCPEVGRTRTVEDLHPILRGMREGNHYAYTYPERLVGAIDTMANSLATSPTNRRTFWPIFQPVDAIRMGAMTRIPCSLGYQAMIRQTPGSESPKLHLTYISRSCDFEKFWITDIWLAHQFQRRLLMSVLARRAALSGPDAPPVILGATSHIILSFHRFETEGEEIY